MSNMFKHKKIVQTTQRDFGSIVILQNNGNLYIGKKSPRHAFTNEKYRNRPNL
jgi:hypothetical protein